MNTTTSQTRLPFLLNVATVFFVLALFTYRIWDFPVYGSDEPALINIIQRFVDLGGDSRYPVSFSELGSTDAWREYPPITSLLPRSLLHLATGIDPAQTRYLSAIATVISCLIFSLLLSSAAGTSWAFSPILITLSLCPGTFSFGRLFRFEHDILLSGMLAVLAVWLTKPGHSRRNYMLWVVAGLCSAWAASSHPLGLVFPASIMIPALAFPRTIVSLDGLGFGPRLRAFIIGASIPAALIALQVLGDWNGNKQYWAVMADYYSRSEVNTANFAAAFDDRFGSLSGTPAWLKAKLAEFDQSAYPVWAPPSEARDFYRDYFWVALLPSLFVSPFILIFRDRHDANARVYPLVMLPLMYFAISFIYPPKGNYGLYLNTFVLTSAIYAILSLIRLYAPVELKMSALLSVLVLISIPSMIFSVRTANDLRTDRLHNPNLPLPEKFRNLAEIAANLGLNKNEHSKYCDFITWSACFPNERSIFATIIMGVWPVDDTAIGFVADAQSMETMVKSPNMTGGDKLIERRQRLARATRGQQIAAIVFEAETAATYIYFAKKLQEDSILRLCSMKRGYPVTCEKFLASRALSSPGFLITPPSEQPNAGFRALFKHSILPNVWEPTDINFRLPEGISYQPTSPAALRMLEEWRHTRRAK